jgi:MFS transporter, ACS family, tartrate transporter
MSTAEPSPSADEAALASALRKASLRLLPLIALGYGASYIDRVNISFAALQMNRDLHFSASIYGLGAGLFFLSYAACEVPSNLMLYRFGARRWIARIMLTWGILAICMMFVKTPIQFYVARFFLGAAEAGFFPGVAFYLMQWFPAHMRARAISRFYIAVPLSTAVMGSIAGALLNLNGRLGLAGWQWLFIVEGIPPILLSVVFLNFLPDSPAQAKWLTPAERTALATQLQSESATAAHSENILRALRDPRVLLTALTLVCMLTCAYAYAFSAPAIIQKLTGLSVTRVGFIVALNGLLGALAMLLNALHSDRARERHLHIAIPLLLTALGYTVGGLSVVPLIAIPALSLSWAAFFATQGPMWVIASDFLHGRCAAACIAAINTVAILGGFIGPYWMGIAKDLTGNYQRGLLTLTIPSLIGAALVFHMRRQSQLAPQSHLPQTRLAPITPLIPPIIEDR